jgi:protein-tyrosine-phosphatase
MAGAALSKVRPDLSVETAGTMTIDGQPISFRTRAALDHVGLPRPQHRSRQADRALLDAADLIVGLAPEHVAWVRRDHPEAAPRTATLIRLGTDLASSDLPLGQRVAALQLADVELEAWEEVVDPGGGEVDAFMACARKIVTLVEQFAQVL